jgi:hypothetical protein
MAWVCRYVEWWQLDSVVDVDWLKIPVNQDSMPRIIHKGQVSALYPESFREYSCAICRCSLRACSLFTQLAVDKSRKSRSPPKTSNACANV